MALANQTSQVAVKTPWGKITKRKMMQNIEMQGTVIAPLKCSVQIGSVGESALTEKVGYKYRGCLLIPPLSFMDDLLSISNCSLESTKMNAIIQSKVNSRHLKLGASKCTRMHIGASRSPCPLNKVHDDEVLEENKVTYIGSILSSNGKVDTDIQARHGKGMGCVNGILNMLNENFFFTYFQTGLLFRNSMLINGMLYSLEAFAGIKDNHIKSLEKCDKYFFATIFQSGACTPSLSYYWETGELPIKFILMGRRLIFSGISCIKMMMNWSREFMICKNKCQKNMTGFR